MAEAACSCGKSGLFICQKKPIHVAKEAYSRGKRDLLILAYLGYARSYPYMRGMRKRHKRPIYMAKEAY
jgi:hypothetical protein